MLVLVGQPTEFEEFVANLNAANKAKFIYVPVTTSEIQDNLKCTANEKVIAKVRSLAKKACRKYGQKPQMWVNNASADFSAALVQTALLFERVTLTCTLRSVAAAADNFKIAQTSPNYTLTDEDYLGRAYPSGVVLAFDSCDQLNTDALAVNLATDTGSIIRTRLAGLASDTKLAIANWGEGKRIGLLEEYKTTPKATFIALRDLNAANPLYKAVAEEGRALFQIETETPIALDYATDNIEVQDDVLAANLIVRDSTTNKLLFDAFGKAGAERANYSL